MFTPYEFEAIRSFILEKGDRQTYCNMFNNNPHYRFTEAEVYLNPAPGGPHNHPQWNINCDADRSGFDTIVARTDGADHNLYHHLTWPSIKTGPGPVLMGRRFEAYYGKKSSVGNRICRYFGRVRYYALMLDGGLPAAVGRVWLAPTRQSRR